jgi:hypothetical protein
MSFRGQLLIRQDRSLRISVSRAALIFIGAFTVPVLVLLSFDIVPLIYENRGADLAGLGSSLRSGNLRFSLMYLVPVLSILFLNFQRSHIPLDGADLQIGKTPVPRTECAALQICSKLITSRRIGGFTGYELNLVLKDGQRLNLMDHGNIHSLAGDGRVLADELGLPLWYHA